MINFFLTLLSQEVLNYVACLIPVSKGEMRLILDQYRPDIHILQISRFQFCLA